MTALEMNTMELEADIPRLTDLEIKSIVVATDGSESALAAFKAASLIAGRKSAEVHVVSVLEPMPTSFSTGEGMFVLPDDFYQSRDDSQRAVIRDQTAAFDPDETWKISLCIGRAAETIVSFAHDHNADLIIVGANRHGVVGRIFGEETAMQIVGLSDVPLLVASSGMRRLPRRIVVAMDLDAEGLQCAPEVLAIIADTASISCAHVKPRVEFLGIDLESYDRSYEVAMRERFKTVQTGMNAVRLRPDLVVLHGDAAHELVEFGAYCKAELMVVGVRRRHGRARSVGGRIAGRVLRHAPCSVLIVPRLIDVVKETSNGGTTTVIKDSLQWALALRSFSERNAGRAANLEVDDPEFGALIEARNYPLRGVDYDHKDGRLTISLGYTSGADRHLTRSIEHPEAVSVLSVAGRDTALSVTHGGGQTLLTF